MSGRTRGMRCAIANVCAGVALAVAGVLYRFPPEQHSFYPQCPVFHYLHVLCPGCGATRALAALLHLRWEAALQYNALVVVLLPFVMVYFAAAYWRACTHEDFAWPRVPAFAAAAGLAAALVFGVVRNAAALLG